MKIQESDTKPANRQKTEEDDHDHLGFKIEDFRLAVGFVANLQSEI